MEVVDAFCGAGGFSAGAMAAGCRVAMGIDSDPTPLKLWAANTGGRAVCATIGPAAARGERFGRGGQDPEEGRPARTAPTETTTSSTSASTAKNRPIGSGH